MDVYGNIGLRRVINGSGRMTALGVSTISDEVALWAKNGGQNYVIIDELIDRAGEIISQYTGGEDSLVTSSASAGIALSIAGLITKGKLSLLEKLPNTEGLANEVIIQKGHAVNYGAPITTMISLAGGKPIEVGHANEVFPAHIEEAITEKTVALMYVKSHHCVQKGMVSLEEMIKIAHNHNLPILVDAAAEEDLRLYIEKGADLVAYSGAKAIEATTSGFVTGKKEYITYAKRQYKGIGRAMKVGKENIIGLLKALEIYANKDKEKELNEQLKVVEYLIEEINKLRGLSAQLTVDEAGRKIYRAEMKVDSEVLGRDAKAMLKELHDGNPSIHARKHRVNLGYITFDPRPLNEGDEVEIINRLKELVEEK